MPVQEYIFGGIKAFNRGEWQASYVIRIRWSRPSQCPPQTEISFAIMSPESIFTDASKRPPLDDSLFSLEADEEAFFKELTGITDDEELRRHIIGIQKQAYEVLSAEVSFPFWSQL